MKRTTLLVLSLAACGPIEVAPTPENPFENFALIARDNFKLGAPEFERESWDYDDQGRLVNASELYWCRCSGLGVRRASSEVSYLDGVYNLKVTREDLTFVTEVELDDEWRPTLVQNIASDGERSTERYIYDQRGDLLSIERSARFDEEVVRNGAGQVELYLHDDQVVSRFFYDDEGRQVMRTGNGTYNFEYDEEGRVIERRYTFAGSTSVTTLEYDDVGRLVRRVAGPNEERVTYEEGRLASRTFTNADLGTEQRTAWTYDDDGRVVAQTSAGGTTRYTYEDVDGDVVIRAIDDEDTVLRAWTLREFAQPVTRPTLPNFRVPIVDARIENPLDFLER